MINQAIRNVEHSNTLACFSVGQKDYIFCWSSNSTIFSVLKEQTQNLWLLNYQSLTAYLVYCMPLKRYHLLLQICILWITVLIQLYKIFGACDNKKCCTWDSILDYQVWWTWFKTDIVNLWTTFLDNSRF